MRSLDGSESTHPVCRRYFKILGCAPQYHPPSALRVRCLIKSLIIHLWKGQMLCWKYKATGIDLGKPLRRKTEKSHNSRCQSDKCGMPPVCQKEEAYLKSGFLSLSSLAKQATLALHHVLFAWMLPFAGILRAVKREWIHWCDHFVPSHEVERDRSPSILCRGFVALFELQQLIYSHLSGYVKRKYLRRVKNTRGLFAAYLQKHWATPVSWDLSLFTTWPTIPKSHPYHRRQWRTLPPLALFWDSVSASSLYTLGFLNRQAEPWFSALKAGTHWLRAKHPGCCLETRDHTNFLFHQESGLAPKAYQLASFPYHRCFQLLLEAGHLSE